MNDSKDDFHRLLEDAVRFHGHLCGGQVIGVKMAMAALRELGIEDSRGKEGRDLVIFVEIDRCATDAIISVTGRTPGKRSIKIMDYGKMAATFVDTRPGGSAIRVSLRGDATETVQQIAQTYMPQKDEKQANIAALIAVPEEDLLKIQQVSVTLRPEDLPGEPLDIVVCSKCGEMVKDMRHVALEGASLCRPCASGETYYRTADVSSFGGTKSASRG
jgi:formylmethanofuran dehydrogenase subunit E